jgi:hypothetical protein
LTLISKEFAPADCLIVANSPQLKSELFIDYQVDI